MVLCRGLSGTAQASLILRGSFQQLGAEVLHTQSQGQDGGGLPDSKGSDASVGLFISPPYRNFRSPEASLVS